jgi:hypothetical protein
VAPPRAHTFGVRRVTQRELKLFLPGIEIRDPGGITATRLAATDDPEDPSDDDEITLVAVDRGAGRLLTNLGLLQVTTWDGSGTAIGPLELPWDVAIDRAGRVAITDPGRRRVVLLRHDGRSIEPERAFDGFLEPAGIAADGRGGFWVCDRRFNTVFHLDTETGHRSTFGLEVAFDRPIDVAAVGADERLARGHAAGLVIVDRDGGRIRAFGRAGELRASRDASTLEVPDAVFDAVEIDYYGNVVAVDRTAHRIHKLREDLLPLDSFGGRGADEGQFVEPRGIAIHRRLGQVFVTERNGGQYLWVGTDVKAFAARDAGSGVRFAFRLTEESTLDLRVLDAQGRPVAEVVRAERLGAGPHELGWSGVLASGDPAPRGDYLAEVRARATYASRSTFERKLLRPFTLGLGRRGP